MLPMPLRRLGLPMRWWGGMCDHDVAMMWEEANVVAISRFSCSAHDARDIEARFRGRPRLVDHHDGFLGCEVLKTGIDPVTFVLITRWANRANLKAYLQSEDFRRVYAAGEEAGADFKVYDLVGR